MLENKALSRPVTSRTMHRLHRSHGWQSAADPRIQENNVLHDCALPGDEGFYIDDTPLEAHDTLALDEQSMADLPLVQRTLIPFFNAPETIHRRCSAGTRLNCTVSTPDGSECDGSTNSDRSAMGALHRRSALRALHRRNKQSKSDRRQKGTSGLDGKLEQDLLFDTIGWDAMIADSVAGHPGIPVALTRTGALDLLGSGPGRRVRASLPGACFVLGC